MRLKGAAVSYWYCMGMYRCYNKFGDIQLRGLMDHFLFVGSLRCKAFLYIFGILPCKVFSLGIHRANLFGFYGYFLSCPWLLGKNQNISVYRIFKYFTLTTRKPQGVAVKIIHGAFTQWRNIRIPICVDKQAPMAEARALPSSAWQAKHPTHLLRLKA